MVDSYSLIPTIYHKRITLENSSRVNQKERNPHIDSEREPEIVKNPITGKLEKQIITPDFAKKNLSKDMLIVNIDFLLKEKLDNSLIGTWFFNEDIIKYLKVCVIQSLDSKLTDLIISNQLDLNMNAIEKLDTMYASSMDYKTILIKDIIKKSKENSKSILEQYESYNDGKGNKIIDIDFRVNFTIKGNGNPEHLFYYSFCFLDMEQMSKDYHMNVSPNQYSFMKGKESAEIVIDKSSYSTQLSKETINYFNVVSETFIFTDESNQIWSGNYYKDEQGRWLSGNIGDPNSKLLHLKTITNTKIQDFRSLRELEKVELDFSFLENEDLLANKIKVLSNDNLDISPKVNYFSSFSMARDSEGNCRFLFGVDYLRLAREKTIFGKLYNNDTSLLSNVKIRNLRVYRVRLPNNYASSISNEEGMIFFNESEDIPELITFSRETRTGGFVQNTYSLKGIDIGTIRELDIGLENQNIGVRHFTGIDKQMKNVTFGYYKYYVELEIEDNTNQLLVDKLDELINSYETLKEFYNKADSFDNFDPYTGRYKGSFIEEQEAKYQNESNPKNIPWIYPISSYLSIITIFNSKLNVDKYQNILFSMLHPRTGTIDGILSYMKLMETLMNKIGSMIGSTVSGKVSKWKTGSKTTQASSFSRGKTPTKTFLVKVYSDSVFDSDVLKNVGYDFLSETGKLEKEKNDDGLSVISNITYSKRTELETLKYFKNIDTDINLKNSKFTYTQDDSIEGTRYSYLTPSNINLGPRENENLIGQGEGLFNVLKYGTILTDIIQFNSLKNSPQISMVSPTINNIGFSARSMTNNSFEELRVAANLNNIGNKFSVIISPVEEKQVSPYKESVIREMKAEKNQQSSTNNLIDAVAKGVSIANNNTTTMTNRRSILGGKSTDSFSEVNIKTPKVTDEETTKHLIDSSIIFGNSSTFNKEDIKIESYEQFDVAGKNKEQKIKEVKSNALMTMIFFPIIENGIKGKINSGKDQNDNKKKKNSIDFYNLNKSDNCIDLLKLGSVAEFRDTKLGPIKLANVNLMAVSQNSLTNNSVSERKNSVSNLSNNLVQSSISSISQAQVTSNINNSFKALINKDVKVGNVVWIAEENKQRYIKYLPNQVKSLLLASVGADKVLKNWFSIEERNKNNSLDTNNNVVRTLDPLKDPDDSLIFNLNYKMIKTIEVLIGYNVSTSGNLIKEQIWEPLTKARINNANQKNLLCRIKTYSNGDLNIESPKGLELPVYNEYFLITYENKIINFKPINQNLIARKIEDNLMAINDQNKLSIRNEFQQSIIMSKDLSIDRNIIKEQKLDYNVKTQDMKGDISKQLLISDSDIKNGSNINVDALKSFSVNKFGR